MDNSSDSVGLVADWIAVARWWRSHPPVARRGGSDSDHQSSHGSSSCINPQSSVLSVAF